MKQSPSWETNRFAASQEIPSILWNPNVNYRIHKCLPPVSILRHINTEHTPTTHFLKISEPALCRFLTFQVPNLTYFRCLGRTKVSLQVRGFGCEYFVTKIHFHGEELQPFAQPPSWRTTPCRLSATAYSIYSQLPSILEFVPPSATWGRAMPWWQGPICHMDWRVITKIIHNIHRKKKWEFWANKLKEYNNIQICPYVCDGAE
jgi:hypothetical protein